MVEDVYICIQRNAFVGYNIPRLPEKQRIVFNLRYYDELEYEDIARVLDSKVETLKVNYHYAKDKIKEYILNR